MGYSRLSYEEYMDHIEYWLGEKGVRLPLWADELSAKGFHGVSALDFYGDLFCDYLEQHVDDPADYSQGEYAAIAMELKRRNSHGQLKQYAHRKTITQDLEELFTLIDESENFCLMSAASYAGFRRLSANARDLFALVIEIDSIQPKGGIANVVYFWQRENLTLPQPTYIVCSGTGLHLYYVFEKPIPLWKNVANRLAEIKVWLTKMLWQKPVTQDWKRIQFEPVLQAFRLVGTRGKEDGVYAMAFKTGPKLTIEAFNQCLPDKLQLEAFYKSSCSLKKAQELYPDWYQRRIVDGEDPGTYNRYQPIYYNWIEKMRAGATLGHRYNCLENLCSLAVQCQIEPEQVEHDVRELAVFLDGLSADAEDIKKHGHFTEYDIMCALRTYYEPTRMAYTRKTEVISKKTGIELIPNKRNHRPQEIHMRRITALRDLDYENGAWRNKDGAPKQLDKVKAWRKEHPTGSKYACIKDTGLSKNTVYKWWDA